jgi:phosphotransferase system  glucose/maltose/N-acetylglucosamine-specific IIC component
VITVLGAAIGLLVWAAILFALTFAVYGLIRWRGGWRLAAAVPPVVVLLLYKAHSLWSLLFVPLAMLLCAYSAAVVLLHRRKANPRTPTL